MGFHLELAMGYHRSSLGGGTVAAMILPVTHFDPVCPGLGEVALTSCGALEVKVLRRIASLVGELMAMD